MRVARRRLVCVGTRLDVRAQNSSVKPSFNLTVKPKATPQPCCDDVAYTVTVPPPRIPLSFVYAYSGCIHNLDEAVRGRIGLPVPTISTNYVTYINYHATLWGKILNREHPYTRQWTLEEVVQSYTGLKRRRYQKAMDEILHGTKDIDSKLKCFVKIESSMYKSSKAFPTPRPIQFRDFKYALQFATLVKPIEHITYPLSGMPKLGILPCIAKNLNNVRRAELLRQKFEMFVKPVAYMLDAHRYDAHVQPRHIRAKWRFYDQVLQTDQSRVFHRNQLRTRGSAYTGEHKLSYSVAGTTCSGDMDTALGNCLIMLLTLSYIFSNLDVKYELLVDGDDSVVITEGYVDQDRLLELAKQTGFVFSFDGVTQKFEEISFCQCNPVLVDGKWIMVRNPYRAISKCLTNTKFQDHKSIPKRLRTIAQGELSLSLGVPILQTFFTHLKLISEAKMSSSSFSRNGGWCIDALGEYRLQREMGPDWQLATPRPISIQTRKSFEAAFGIAANEQLQIEDSITQWSLPTSLVPVDAETIDDRWDLPLQDPTGSLHMGFDL